jgi:hypothetical protein
MPGYAITLIHYNYGNAFLAEQPGISQALYVSLDDDYAGLASCQ